MVVSLPPWPGTGKLEEDQAVQENNSRGRPRNQAVALGNQEAGSETRQPVNKWSRGDTKNKKIDERFRKSDEDLREPGEGPKKSGRWARNKATRQRHPIGKHGNQRAR